MRNKLISATLLLAVAGASVSIRTVHAQQTDPPSSNLKVGEKIPELSGTDQFGKLEDFNSLRGQNGLVVLFFRSADW